MEWVRQDEREGGKEGGNEQERERERGGREGGRKSDDAVEVEEDGVDGGPGRLLVDPLVT